MTDFSPRQDIFLHSSAPQTAKQLSDFLMSRVRFPSSPFGLEMFLSRNPQYLHETIPFLWAQAKESLPLIKPLHEKRRIERTQLEVLRILSHSFFCSFTRDSHRWEDYPSINMDRMFVEPSQMYDAKLGMFFEYFSRQQKRLETGDVLDRKIIFQLHSSSKSWEEWASCPQKLQPFVVHPLKASIDDAKDAFRVDFANRYLGGAALSHGCVQEEIMFVLFPELNAGRLFSAAMQDTQTIVMQGCEQFSLPKGYGWSFSNGGPYEDPTEIAHGMMQSHIVAMDAVDYRYERSRAQYSAPHMLRELNKCYSGFCAENTPEEIATGNWGCGVFGGNAELKSLLQWASASMAGKSIAYFPFDHEVIAKQYGENTRLAVQKELRVCDLIQLVSSIDPKESVARQFAEWVQNQ